MSWIGGKMALRELIVGLFPIDFERYIEVFGGGGWVLFHKEPGPFEVYNDFNSLLVGLFRCVRDKPEELIDALRFTLNSREDFEIIKNALARDSPMSDVKRAAYFYQLIRYSYASGLTSFASQPHDLEANFELLRKAHRRLRRVVIENKDCRKLIRQYDRPVSFFYLDPPYYETEGYYHNIGEDGFTEADHTGLRDTLLGMEGKFLLSYNDHPFVRELYNAPGIWIMETSRINNIKQRYDGGCQFNELLIANYDLRERQNAAPLQMNLFEEEPVRYGRYGAAVMPGLGSLFDGIGGFPLAGVHNGITPVWASEIEAFPIEVSKLRFPGMRHVGDITKLKGGALPPVEVVTGGSPCQDLSVAGQRAGLAGERSGLFMEQIRIIKEMRCADEKRGRAAHAVRPRYMVWENVPGAFSSAGCEDFRAVLEETCRIADGGVSVPRPPGGVWKSAGAILGAEFSLAWRVLDAQYWPRTPQRRKRIYLVADFAGHSAPKILFEQNRLFGDSKTGAGPGQGAAPTASGGAGDSGRDYLTPWDVQSHRVFEDDGIWPALYGGEGGGHGYVQTEEQGIGFDGYNGNLTKNTAATLGVNCGMSTGRNGILNLPISFAANQRDEVRDLQDVAGALGAQPGMKQQTFVAVPVNTQIATRHKALGEGTGFGVGEDGDPSFTLQAAHSHGVFVGQNCLTPWDTQQERIFTPQGKAPTLAGADGGGGRNPAGLLFSAGFCAGAGPSTGGIGYNEELSPTLKASESGTNMVPSILCLNDQGGQCMSVSTDISGTLRAQMNQHQPLVLAAQQDSTEDGEATIPSSTEVSSNNPPLLFDNHPVDSRCTGPLAVSPTVSAGYGTGGNNIPLVTGPEADSFCIAGNIIDRQDHNGGNGFGYQTGISYTLNTADRHAIYEPYQEVVGALCRGDEKGVGSQYVSQDKCIVMRSLIRRLTPLECERLQGFPDGWTDIPGASDSARYKALGNSVAIPCVDFVLRGIAFFLQEGSD